MRTKLGCFRWPAYGTLLPNACIRKESTLKYTHTHSYNQHMRYTFRVRLKIKIALPSTTIYRLQGGRRRHALYSIVFIAAPTFRLRLQLMQCLNSVSLLLSTFSLPLAIIRYSVIRSQSKIDFVCCARPMSKKRKLSAHIGAKLFRCFVIV